MLVSTHYKEGHGRAEIKKADSGYVVEFYNERGDMIESKNFFDKSIYFVEDVAENWTLGYKVING